MKEETAKVFWTGVLNRLVRFDCPIDMLNWLISRLNVEFPNLVFNLSTPKPIAVATRIKVEKENGK